MSLSEIAIGTVTKNRFYLFYNDYQHNLLLIGLPSKLLYYVSTLFVVYWFRPVKDPLQKDKKTLFFCLVPLLSVGIMNTLLYICLYLSLPDRLDHMITASTLSLLAINILVFGLHDYNQKRHRQFTDMQLQLQRESDSVQYYKSLLAQDENQRILIHDIKKHLNTIALLNERGEPERINAYIDQITHSDELKESVRICDNDLLNAILNHYQQRCRQDGIEIRLDIRSGVLDFVEDNDLTTIFYNLLDNALTSAQKQNDAFIELSAGQKSDTPFTVLTMVNSCRTDPFSGKTGRLISEKPDTLRHGLGMKSVERIAGKYNGNLKSYYSGDTKTFHTILTLKKMKTRKLQNENRDM